MSYKRLEVASINPFFFLKVISFFLLSNCEQVPVAYVKVVKDVEHTRIRADFCNSQ
jgi:hypothetical protein